MALILGLALRTSLRLSKNAPGVFSPPLATIFPVMFVSDCGI